MQQSSATPNNRDVGRGLRKIVEPFLAVASCIYSFWHGDIPTSYFNDFLHLFHSFSPNREHLQQHRGLPSLALRMILLPSTDGYATRCHSHVPYIYAQALALSAKIRMCEIELVTRVAYCGNSKDHVQPVSKRLCIIFMACSCPNFVLGCLKKKKKRKKKKKMEKIAGFSVFRI